MTERVFAIAGDWAVGADEVQWILYRRQKGGRTPWKGISFVRSTRDILARCMREKGVDERQAVILLAGLPDTFDQWNAARCALQTPSAVPTAEKLVQEDDPPHG